MLSQPLSMTTFVSEAKEFVNAAQGVDELLGVLRLIPLQNIKDLIIETIEALDDKEVRSKCIAMCPISSIIPSDALQHVLSFIPRQSTVQLVDKEFQKLYSLNELQEIELTQSDWDTMVKVKRTEIDELIDKSNQLVAAFGRRHADLINQSQRDLESLLCIGDEMDSKIPFCRVCCVRASPERLGSCGECDIYECTCQYVECDGTSGFRECKDAVFCPDCAESFVLQLDGKRLCLDCSF